MSGRSAKIWLVTIVLAIVPLGGLFLLLYRAGRLVIRKRRPATDSYDDWLALRDLVRSRRLRPVAAWSRDPVAPERAARPERIEPR